MLLRSAPIRVLSVVTHLVRSLSPGVVPIALWEMSELEEFLVVLDNPDLSFRLSLLQTERLFDPVDGPDEVAPMDEGVGVGEDAY